jgi:chemotaxis protein MotB
MRRQDPMHDQNHNHEAWAIPYGDLVTLLLAFFVVMYATSSLNEGKYRVLSSALSEAFGGAPRSAVPAASSSVDAILPADVVAAANAQSMGGIAAGIAEPSAARAPDALQQIADDIEKALAPLLDEDLVAVRRHGDVIEIEIRSDILFSSGSAEPSAVALRAVQLVSVVLKPLDNLLRVEGHTDDQAIRTVQYPSNWELSAARAARVVREFAVAGIDPARLSIVGYGQYRPVMSNAIESGRNANRRVVLTVFSSSASHDALLPGAIADNGESLSPSISAASTTQPGVASALYAPQSPGSVNLPSPSSPESPAQLPQP